MTSSLDARTAPLPPRTQKRPHAYDVHGVAIQDDYAWLKAENWQDVLRDPQLAYLANHDGVLHVLRQPGVPVTAPLSRPASVAISGEAARVDLQPQDDMGEDEDDEDEDDDRGGADIGASEAPATDSMGGLASKVRSAPQTALPIVHDAPYPHGYLRKRPLSAAKQIALGGSIASIVAAALLVLKAITEHAGAGARR